MTAPKPVSQHGGHGSATTAAALAGPATAWSAAMRTAGRQRRVWSRRAKTWDDHGAVALRPVTEAVLAQAAARPGHRVLDLGCGTGQLSIPLAERGADVLAVDVSQVMIERLTQRAERQVPGHIQGSALPIEQLMLPAGSVDLIVSSYALHHLRDADKARLVSAAFHWLRPGGRLIVADMMFGRGSSPRDRSIIGAKLTALARKGVGGWWRIAKNAVRYLLRIHERPISMEKWTALFSANGFTEIRDVPLVAEAGMVTGRRP
jgi:2-polyprenyl-3-methyl-5-hydroxy-6-metoxy-1,4-benzoquinol methylase